MAALAARQRRALVTYITAGHPTPEGTVSLMQALEQAGADVIEVGVPFSDPMADGPVIQASSHARLCIAGQAPGTRAGVPGGFPHPRRGCD